jgi:general secretion pathway protein B
VSYILDALTKAAQQRDRQVPVVQRLLSPAPRPRALWRHTSGRLLAALAVNAVLLAAVLIWWLRPASVTTPAEPIAAAPEPVTVSAPPPPAPPAASARPLVKLEPLPSAAIKAEKLVPPTPEPRTETRVAPARPSESPTTASQVVAPAPAAPVAVAPPPAPPRPRAGTPTIQATTPPPAPATAARAPAPPEAAGLRLEALIYAEAPAERMVFINGRRYREGDSIDGRLKIEEIREDSVELSDQGRRFALRVAR